MLAKLIDFLLCRFTSFITGVRPQKNVTQQSTGKNRLYYANHNSHGDFILLWVSLPYEVRQNTRPVAGADYWLKGKVRRFLAKKVFNMLLI
ncbi:TPA: 1-acyl-sn-glycerol-3-phosphate acyltransferase, partial [Pasteurella multocida]|nr:1-acyl-sn-glycerol-3-phosphate acyltransferase [Pasteurella multocida]